MLMAKPASRRFQRSVFWARAHKFYSLFLLIAILVVGIFVYEKVALELNRRAFSQARAAIDTIYADIVAQVGQPDNSKRSNTCSRPNVVFGQGSLSCDISTSFIYGVTNEDQANNVFKKTQQIVGQQKTFKPVMLEPAITSAPVGNTIYTSATDRYKAARGIDCTMSYWYDTPRQTDLEINDKSKKTFEIMLNCNGWAKDQYYPKNI